MAGWWLGPVTTLESVRILHRGCTESYTKLPLIHVCKKGMEQVAARVQSNGWHFEHVAVTMKLNMLQ